MMTLLWLADQCEWIPITVTARGDHIITKGRDCAVFSSIYQHAYAANAADLVIKTCLLYATQNNTKM